MNFSSLREYFYKMANRCYLLVLLPLVVFIYLYRQLEAGRLKPFFPDERFVTISIAVLIGVVLIYLTFVQFLSRKRLRRYAAEVGLGLKLDHYYEVTMFRIRACSASSLLMALGLALTGSQLFGIFFMVILLWTLVYWPSSRKACRALQLKGDEYDMVFFKKDKF